MAILYSTDIHGTRAWVTKFEKVRHQYPNAQIVLSGDYIDRNRADCIVLDYLWHLKKI